MSEEVDFCMLWWMGVGRYSLLRCGFVGADIVIFACSELWSFSGTMYAILSSPSSPPNARVYITI